MKVMKAMNHPGMITEIKRIENPQKESAVYIDFEDGYFIYKYYKGGLPSINMLGPVPKGQVRSISKDALAKNHNMAPYKMEDGFFLYRTLSARACIEIYNKYQCVVISEEAKLRLDMGGDMIGKSQALDANVLIPENEYGLTPYGFQRAGIRYVLDAYRKSIGPDGLPTKGVLIADEMGLGKTVQAICVALSTESIKNILILCPKNVVSNWQNELQKWLLTGDPRFCVPSEKHFRKYDIKPALIKSGLNMVRASMIAGMPEPGIWILPYTSLTAASPLNPKKKMIDEIEEMPAFDLLVADECQNIKHASSQKTKAFFRIPCKHRLALSGTPSDKVSDMFSICHWLDPKVYKYRAAFIAKYEDNSGQLLEEMRESIMVARQVNDVLTEIPPLVKTLRYLPAPRDFMAFEEAILGGIGIDTEEAQRQYEELSAKIVSHNAKAERELAKAHGTSEYKEVVARISREFSSLVAKIDSTELNIPFEDISRIRAETGKNIARPAAEDIMEFLSENPGEKIVVFYHHKAVGDVLQRTISAKYKVVRADGETSASAKDDAIHSFQYKDAVVFLASITSMNAGITLTAAATVFMVEQSWNGSEVAQAIKRIHRIGQDRLSTAVFYVLENSIMQRVLSISTMKEMFINRLNSKING